MFSGALLTGLQVLTLVALSGASIWRAHLDVVGMISAKLILLLNSAASLWVASEIWIRASNDSTAAWVGHAIAISGVVSALLLAIWEFAASSAEPPRWVHVMLIVQPITLLALGVLGIGTDGLGGGFFMSPLYIFEAVYALAVAAAAMWIMFSRSRAVSRLVLVKMSAIAAIVVAVAVSELSGLAIGGFFVALGTLMETWASVSSPVWTPVPDISEPENSDDSEPVFVFDVAGHLGGWNAASRALMAGNAGTHLRVGLSVEELFGIDVDSLERTMLTFTDDAGMAIRTWAQVSRETSGDRVVVLSQFSWPRTSSIKPRPVSSAHYLRDELTGALSADAVLERLSMMMLSDGSRIAVVRIDVFDVRPEALGVVATDLLAQIEDIRPGALVGRLTRASFLVMAPAPEELDELTLRIRSLVETFERKHGALVVVTPLKSHLDETFRGFVDRVATVHRNHAEPARQPRWY